MKHAKKRVRIIKKIRESSGAWRFVSLQKIGNRYVWDERHGYYFLDWREGNSRKRELAGQTPSEATEAHRRKQNELIGQLLANGRSAPVVANESFTLISKGKEMFMDHVKAHSPDKPETIRRYTQVLDHFERLLGHKKYIEAIDRGDIDTYKIKRSTEKSLRHDRLITPRTINFEVSTLRTFFIILRMKEDSNLKIPAQNLNISRIRRKRPRANRPSIARMNSIGFLPIAPNMRRRSLRL